MNMILHDFPTANILSGNTLAAPKFKDGEQLRTYDYVVANPPFSDKTWTTGLTPAKDPFQRFAWGVPPAKQGDYAYLLHIIRSMKSTGKAACILPHGVLFRGNAEAVIRQQLVRSGYLKGIIGLPANLFYGTGIPACILVLDKENAAGRKGVFMIDASKGFKKDGPRTACASRTSTGSWIPSPNRWTLRAMPAWCRSTRSPIRRTTTTSTCRATSTAPSPRTFRTSTATCAAASRSATWMRSARTGRCSPACAPRCSSPPAAPAMRG